MTKQTEVLSFTMKMLLQNTLRSQKFWCTDCTQHLKYWAKEDTWAGANVFVFWVSP